MVQNRDHLGVELQGEQQPTAGQARSAITGGESLGRLASAFAEAAVAQFLIIGTVLIAGGTVPDDNFHMIGRYIAGSHIAVVHSLPVMRANPPAIHLHPTPF
jgi:hypothetical protein